MSAEFLRARRLALASAVAGLTFGAAGLWLGLSGGLPPVWGLGAACLLLTLPALSLASRLADGLGNRGLERERILLRTVAVLHRLLALGLALAAAQGWSSPVTPDPGAGSVAFGALAVLLFGGAWLGKRRLAGIHPALEADANRAGLPLELAGLLLAGLLLRGAFPWADAATTLALALRLFVAGQSLARATTLSAASCGSCGSCGCS